MEEGIIMRTFGLFEAKQKLSELVERAREGEKIGITRRGQLAAVLVPAVPENSLNKDRCQLTTSSNSNLFPLAGAFHELREFLLGLKQSKSTHTFLSSR